MYTDALGNCYLTISEPLLSDGCLLKSNWYLQSSKERERVRESDFSCYNIRTTRRNESSSELVTVSRDWALRLASGKRRQESPVIITTVKWVGSREREREKKCARYTGRQNWQWNTKIEWREKLPWKQRTHFFMPQVAFVSWHRGTETLAPHQVRRLLSDMKFT